MQISSTFSRLAVWLSAGTIPLCFRNMGDIMNLSACRDWRRRRGEFEQSFICSLMRFDLGEFWPDSRCLDFNSIYNFSFDLLVRLLFVLSSLVGSGNFDVVFISLQWCALRFKSRVTCYLDTSAYFSIHYNWISFLGTTIADVCETFLWNPLTKAAGPETHFDPATRLGEFSELIPMLYVQVDMSGVICGPAPRHYPPFPRLN